MASSGLDFGPGVSELSSLQSADDASLLENTRARFEAGHIYSRCGRLLLAVNPYRQLPSLYSEAMLQEYKMSLQPQAELAPHVYAVASAAHMGMLQNNKSQSVIISGESGSGKTESAKILLRYLAEVSTSSESDLHKRVLQTNPIMESFGCAKTLWNNNSSRFGKFLTLQFNSTGRMQGAFMKTYLLEKSRITSQMAGEHNYHVFYTVARGLPSDKKKAWGVRSPEEYSYLNIAQGEKIDWDEFPCDYPALVTAMESIPALEKSMMDCWKVLVAVLHLGDATLKGSGEDDDAEFTSEGRVHAQHAAKLLGCEEAQLTKAICTLNIKAGLDWISKPNTRGEAQSVKDALAKALYSKLFEFVVESINTGLIFGGESRFFIGAVDIFGFECFATNSLEQLCINFANEKLQRMFNEAVFESVLAEYKKEGINVTGMSYEDNTEVVELIEAQGSGLLPLLSEECFFPNGSDASYLNKIKLAHAKNGSFSEERMDRDAFTVSHYPGKVTYSSVGFLEKNKDPLSQDLTVLMQYSDDAFVADLFKEKRQPEIGAKGGARRFKSAKFVGVIDAFRTSLSQLVATLGETKTHFIRCVKPNMDKKAKSFDESVMMRQLYTSGVVQAVSITRAGFPDHLPFAELLSRFALVLPKTKAVGAKGCAEVLKAASVPESSFRIGKTKVFLGVGVLDALERKRMEYIASKALAMQTLARCYLARKELLRRREWRRIEQDKQRAALEAKRAEEEAKLAAEAAAKEAEEDKAKEAEEGDRQKRFQRARQLSFERRTAKKKRDKGGDDDGKAAAAAAAATAAAGSDPALSEEFQRKLEKFQQDVADGSVRQDDDMINVAVVSDIGWRSATGAEATPEDVWAQYDFKCAVSDVLEYAEYLGMDIKEDAHLLWIADEALQAPEPQGWEQRLDPKGGVYYYHPTTGMSLNQHPLDHHYQQFYLQMKAQYDSMYLKGGGGGTDRTASDSSSTLPSESAATSAPPSEPEMPKSRLSRMFSSLSGASKGGSKSGEDMFELKVELQRQQDGLGIGLTLDNIIVEVEHGGSVHAQGELQYGDQIVSVDGNPLNGRMLKDVIVPRRTHTLVVRYSRAATQPPSPRRARASKAERPSGATPRRIEELEVVVTRDAATGRLGFSIDPMNTVVEVDPRAAVSKLLKVGDKIIAVDDQLLNFKRFVDAINGGTSHKLRVARLRAAKGSVNGTTSKRQQAFLSSKKKQREAAKKAAALQKVRSPEKPQPRQAGMPALREVRLVKETDETKIGAVFHRSDDAFDKSFFNVDGSSVQPIIKKVDPESMAERSGLVPGDVVLSVNGISGLSNFQVVEMLRKGSGVFNLVVISGRQIQASMQRR